MISIQNKNFNDIESDHFDGCSRIVFAQLSKNRLPAKVEKFIKKNLKIILIGKPKELHNLALKFNRINRSSRHNSQMGKVFSYSIFMRNRQSNADVNNQYCAYKLASLLKVNVCPYCNRQYTFTIIDNRQGITRPAFDHFLSKSRFPLFGLSLYNLVPSCTICNSTLKGKNHFSIVTHLNPYIVGFDDDCKFRYDPQTIDSSIGLGSDVKIKFWVKPGCKNKRKIERHIKLFKIGEIYSEHRDLVIELVLKGEMQNRDYFQALMDAFPTFNHFGELYRMAFGNYYQPSDFDRRPLAKLTRDILDQIGVLSALEKQFGKGN